MRLECQYKESMVGRMPRRNRRADSRATQMLGDETTNTGAHPADIRATSEILTADTVETLSSCVSTSSVTPSMPIATSMASNLDWPSPLSKEESMEFEIESMADFDWDWTMPNSTVDKIKLPNSENIQVRQEQGAHLNIDCLPMSLIDSDSDTRTSSNVASKYGATADFSSSSGRSSRTNNIGSSVATSAVIASTTLNTANNLQSNQQANYELSCPSPILSTSVQASHSNAGKLNYFQTLCRITHVLEEYQSSGRLKSFPLDQLIVISRACTTDTLAIMRRYAYKMCTCSSIIIMSILDNITVLFGRVLELWTMGNCQPIRGEAIGDTASVEARQRMNQHPNSLPTLQFGVLELDSDEQTVIMKTLISKELRRLVEAFQNVPAYSQQLAMDEGRSIQIQSHKLLRDRLRQLLMAAAKTGVAEFGAEYLTKC